LARMKTRLLLVLAALLGSCAKGQSAVESSDAGVKSEGLAREGSQAPSFDVATHSGERVSLASLRGKPVVLYFYPKDDTPGCTKEASEIRDAYADIKATGAIVLGVSTQDNASHNAFASKYDLPFALVPDNDEALAKAYGVPLRLGLAKRVTFVIDRQGVIAKVFPEVTPAGHAAEILAVLRGLPKS
jgi:peroxiredoxin Q/BCP